MLISARGYDFIKLNRKIIIGGKASSFLGEYLAGGSSLCGIGWTGWRQVKGMAISSPWFAALSCAAYLRGWSKFRLADRITEISLKLYDTCYKYAYKKGIIIADTKFEFGLDANGELYLADEISTPDSSRFWNLADYKVGVSPKSYDKQLVRDWLLNNKVGGEIQFENVPDDVLRKTADIYKECERRLLS